MVEFVSISALACCALIAVFAVVCRHKASRDHTSETLPLLSDAALLVALRGGGSNALDAEPPGASRQRSRDDEALLAWLQVHTRLPGARPLELPHLAAALELARADLAQGDASPVQPSKTDPWWERHPNVPTGSRKRVSTDYRRRVREKLPEAPPFATAATSANPDATTAATTASINIFQHGAHGLATVTAYVATATGAATGAIHATASVTVPPPDARRSSCAVSAAASVSSPASANANAGASPAPATAAGASTSARGNNRVDPRLVATYAARQRTSRMPCYPDDECMRSFENAFPYTPSDDQARASADVERDMIESFRPMHRLICGDVGFGKTELALRAIYRAVCNGRQVIFISPMLALAEQNYRCVLRRMPAHVQVKLLTAHTNTSDKQGLMQAVKSDSVHVVVGTHAIIYAKLDFANLGLLVIDEEQRFGKLDKTTMMESLPSLDVLLLSATPIPSTLQLADAGIDDMFNMSMLRTPLQGRLPVETVVCQHDDTRMLCAIEDELERGGQVLYILPLAADVERKVEQLRSLLPDRWSVDYAYAKLPDADRRIDEFTRGNVSVLVATTKVECGIDVARLNTIIIEDAVCACG